MYVGTFEKVEGQVSQDKSQLTPAASLRVQGGVLESTIIAGAARHRRLSCSRRSNRPPTRSVEGGFVVNEFKVSIIIGNQAIQNGFDYITESLWNKFSCSQAESKPAPPAGYTDRWAS